MLTHIISWKWQDIMKNQREHPRYSCDLNVICGNRVKGTVSKDISLHGMFIKTNPSLFKKGDEFYMIIDVPTRPLPIEIKSRVVRIAGEGVGVKFVGLSTFDLENLTECINFFKDMLPTTLPFQDSIPYQASNL